MQGPRDVNKITSLENAGKLLTGLQNNCQKSKTLLTRFQKLLPKFLCLRNLYYSSFTITAIKHRSRKIS